MIANARVVVRHHWPELSIAVVLALGMAAWTGFVLVRTGLTSVPAGCFERWLTSGPDGAGDCTGPIHAWGSVLVTEGTSISAAMAYIPFAIGLIAGVPIIASELEARTAATAWSLNPSRVAWLARTLVPLIVLVGAGVLALVITTSVLEWDRALWGYSSVEEFGRFGAPVASRVFGAMAVALLVGALLGRTLPALVLAGAVVVALGFGLNVARENWQAGLQPDIITATSSNGELTVIPGAIATDVAFLTPRGNHLSVDDARVLAHNAGAPQPDQGDEQDLPAAAWLEANGYREVSLGITPAAALGWEPYEIAAWALITVAATSGAFLVVDRKRPT